MKTPNGPISNFSWTQLQNVPRLIYIQELRTAINHIDTYSKNVENCGNCAASNCCQSNQGGCENIISYNEACQRNCRSGGLSDQSCQNACRECRECIISTM